MQMLQKANEFIKVTLMWIPEHQGIPCNEEADRLTKGGAIEVPPNQFAVIPVRVDKTTHLEAFGTEASGHVDCLYWLQTVQSANEIFSA
jgi:hypothetical protein